MRNDAERAAYARSRIVAAMVAMDVASLEALEIEVDSILTWGPDNRSNRIDNLCAAAIRWERAQGGTEEVERLRAAVVAMRGGA